MTDPFGAFNQAPPQQYGPPPQQFQAPQGYPQQYPPGQFQPPQQFQGYPAPQMAPPAPPLASGTVDDFYAQPTVGGGPGLKFDNVGDSHVGMVNGACSVIQETDFQTKAPKFFRDGRPKFQLVIPLKLPDGTDARWFVKGADREELVRAMTEAGAPAGPPEDGALLKITYVENKPVPGVPTPRKVKRVDYRRPQGAQSAPPPQAAAEQPAPAPAAAPPPQAAPVPQPAPAPQPAAQAPGLDANGAEMLARFTGQ